MAQSVLVERLWTHLTRTFSTEELSHDCIKKSLTCNGLVDCFHGEDEAFEECHKKSFVEAATIKCIESNRNGEDIEILAVPCNGIRECRDGSDEDNCATMLHFTIDTMMTCCAVAVTSRPLVISLKN